MIPYKISESTRVFLHFPGIFQGAFGQNRSFQTSTGIHSRDRGQVCQRCLQANGTTLVAPVVEKIFKPWVSCQSSQGLNHLWPLVLGWFILVYTNSSWRVWGGLCFMAWSKPELLGWKRPFQQTTTIRAWLVSKQIRLATHRSGGWNPSHEFTSSVKNPDEKAGRSIPEKSWKRFLLWSRTIANNSTLLHNSTFTYIYCINTHKYINRVPQFPES